MRIGIDARELEHPMTGISRYLYEIVQYMPETAFEYYLYCRHKPQVDIQGTNIHIREVGGLPWLWDHIALPHALAKDSIDLFFSPYYKMPWPLTCKSIVTVHDLNVLFDRSYSLLRKAYFKNTIRRSLLKSDRILTVSQYVKQDIIKAFHIDAAKIIVNYNVIDKRFQPLNNRGAVKTALDRYGIDSEYILYVGNLLPSKNVAAILNAYAHLPQNLKDNHRLVIAGRKDWTYRQLVKLSAKLGLENKVIFPGFIDDADLVQVYNGARLFVFPSYREGFGFPPLEAMSCGIPVIASNSTSLPEVLGDAALLINPFDILALTQAMLRILTDEGLKGNLVEKGLRRAKEFSAENTTHRLVEIFGKYS